MDTSGTNSFRKSKPGPIKTIWICTDMEGLAGVDSIDQCYEKDIRHPARQYGIEQLVGDTNAAIAGCFDAGAERVLVWDGHGVNANRGLDHGLDPRAKRVGSPSRDPFRLDALDENIDAVALVGQHSMAGTPNAFLCHTQALTEIVSCRINGEEQGELSQLLIYASHFDVPIIYASGDEALCAEAHRLFPWITTTQTKSNNSWHSCHLDPPQDVRRNIRSDIASAILSGATPCLWKFSDPIHLAVEYSQKSFAKDVASHWERDPRFLDVRLLPENRAEWTINDPRDIFMVGPVAVPPRAPFTKDCPT